jgi:hypothetical protein
MQIACTGTLYFRIKSFAFLLSTQSRAEGDVFKSLVLQRSSYCFSRYTMTYSVQKHNNENCGMPGLAAAPISPQRIHYNNSFCIDTVHFASACMGSLHKVNSGVREFSVCVCVCVCVCVSGCIYLLQIQVLNQFRLHVCV